MCAPTARNAASKLPSFTVSRMFGHLAVQLELDSHIEDALHLAIEHFARQSVFRNAEAHHSAGSRPASMIFTPCPRRRR